MPGVGLGWVAILNRMVTLEQRQITWRKGTFLGRRNSQCEGPKMAACLGCSRKSKEASVAAIQGARGKL